MVDTQKSIKSCVWNFMSGSDVSCKITYIGENWKAIK